MPYEEDEFPSDFDYAKAMRDPAEDGPEVDIIRREMQIAAGVALHWTDKDGNVLCPPMTTAEASQKGIQL